MQTTFLRLATLAGLFVAAGATLAQPALPTAPLRNAPETFFGTTVNIAARLQAQARTSELVVTQALAASLETLFASSRTRRFRASLKGIAAEQELVGFDLRAVDSGATAAGARSADV